MKEKRIIAFIGMNSCLILASTFESIIGTGLMTGIAVIWFIRYVHLSNIKH